MKKFILTLAAILSVGAAYAGSLFTDITSHYPPDMVTQANAALDALEDNLDGTTSLDPTFGSVNVNDSITVATNLTVGGAATITGVTTLTAAPVLTATTAAGTATATATNAPSLASDDSPLWITVTVGNQQCVIAAYPVAE